MTMKAPKTVYLRNEYGVHPRVTTLVYTLGTSPDGRDYAHVGYSICNLVCDSFSRKIGRKIALGRLGNVRTLIFIDYPAGVTTWKGRLACLLTRLAIPPSMEGALVNVPNRLHRAVKSYLEEEPLIDSEIPLIPGLDGPGIADIVISAQRLLSEKT